MQQHHPQHPSSARKVATTPHAILRCLIVAAAAAPTDLSAIKGNWSNRSNRWSLMLYTKGKDISGGALILHSIVDTAGMKLIHLQEVFWYHQYLEYWTVYFPICTCCTLSHILVTINLTFIFWACCAITELHFCLIKSWEKRKTKSSLLLPYGCFV
jgi:hypothetical protein